MTIKYYIRRVFEYNEDNVKLKFLKSLNSFVWSRDSNIVVERNLFFMV